MGNLKRLALLRLNKDIEQLNLSNTESGTIILEKKKKAGIIFVDVHIYGSAILLPEISLREKLEHVMQKTSIKYEYLRISITNIVGNRKHLAET